MRGCRIDIYLVTDHLVSAGRPGRRGPQIQVINHPTGASPGKDISPRHIWIRQPHVQQQPSRRYSGAVIFMPCPQRRFNGVLRAFGVGWYCGIPPPMQHAVRGVLAWFSGVLWYSVFARCVAAPFFPVLIVAAWTLPGPLDMTPPQIVLTGPAMLRGRGPNPGRDSACHSAHGVERVKQLCACARSGSFAPKVAAKVARFCAKVADSR